MEKLQRSDLYSLEKYTETRDQFRAKIIEHKKNRRISIGPNVRLLFEDRLIMHYQIQEMLRIEKIFEPAAIQEELDAYNPLIPDGQNWKVTMMIEFSDADERRAALAKLRGIEEVTWVQVEGFDKVFPIANEDMERTDDEKTSAVHFLRFELTSEMSAALHANAQLKAGIDHPEYCHEVNVGQDIRKVLSRDLD